MTNTIQTVTGTCRPADLGLTLMHEHLIIGWPGWESDTAAPRFDRREAKRLCVDRMLELKSLGVSALVDPCPIDLGRDVEFAAEVAQASGVHIVCATGLYKEESGAAPYFKFRGAFADSASEMSEIFVKEVTEGIGTTGIKAGVIKVATGPHQITAVRAHRHHRRGARPQGNRRADHHAYRRGHDGARAARNTRRGRRRPAARRHRPFVRLGRSALPRRPARPGRLPGLRPLRPRDAAPRPTAARRPHRSARHRLRAPDRALTRHGVVLARAARCPFPSSSSPASGTRATFCSTSSRPCARQVSDRTRSTRC